MTNPAIVAGLLAGYTIGAVVTALAVATDDPAPDAVTGVAAVAAETTGATCSRSVDHRRAAARCWHVLKREHSLRSLRR